MENKNNVGPQVDFNAASKKAEKKAIIRDISFFGGDWNYVTNSDGKIVGLQSQSGELLSRGK